MKSIRSSTARILVASLALTALAAGARAAVSESALQSLVTHASAGTAHLVKVFSGPDGLTGLVVRGNGVNGKTAIAWASPHGQALLAGSVFNLKGENLTDQAARQYVQHTAAAGPLTPTALLDAVSVSATVDQFPRGTKTLYAFVDANCPFCHALYQTVIRNESAILSDGVRIRWVPVAVVSQDSGGRGAAVLQGGLGAWQMNEDAYSAASEQGGIPPSNDPKALAAVAANTALLMRDGQPTATPTLVWRTSDGVKVEVGAPDDTELLAIMKSVQ